MLAPFNNNPNMGGVGSAQQMMPVGKSGTIWEILADFRLSLRMMEACASSVADGGISCLSGRTAVYRRDIVADAKFQREFENETWFGHPLMSGDDKFITRWIVKNGFDMHFQYHEEATLLTTFKPNWHFLKQLLRWTRNTWRSDFRSLFVDRAIWCKHPYVAYTMVDKIFNPLTILYGPIVTIYLCLTHSSFPFWMILAAEVIWILFNRMLRLGVHWPRKPLDIVSVP